MCFVAREEANVFLCKGVIESIVEVDLGVVDVEIQSLMVGAVARNRRQSCAKLFEVAGCFLAFCGAAGKLGLTISICAL